MTRPSTALPPNEKSKTWITGTSPVMTIGCGVASSPNLNESLESNRDLPADLDHLVVRQAEEVADMDRVALHHGEEPLLPAGHPHAVVAADHGFMPDIIGDVGKVDGAAERFTGSEQFRNMRPLHEAEMRFRAPEIRRDLFDREALAGWQPRHRQDFHAQHEHVLVQSA